jgi:hypothetical protein
MYLNRNPARHVDGRFDCNFLMNRENSWSSKFVLMLLAGCGLIKLHVQLPSKRAISIQII